jgi:mannose-6-phosphate isomerase-like protein (cupin superfamily)
MAVFPEPSTWTFENAGVRGKIFPVDALTSKAGFLIIETDSGHQTTIIERDSDFVYYVLSGSGIFSINDIDEPCGAGDLIIVPHGSKFTYSGHVRMLLITVPKWTAEQESIA